jgi:hypothetical protein
MDDSFGSPRLEELLRDEGDTPPGVSSAHRQELHPESERIVNRAYDDGDSEEDTVSSVQATLPKSTEKSHLKRAKMLVNEEAREPSCYESHMDDLEATPNIITGFPGAVSLWPH